MKTNLIDDIPEKVQEDISNFNRKENLINNLSQIFKTLSDPTRIKIIYALMNGPLCVSDISELLGMSQSSISHQLALLRTQNLIKVKDVGEEPTIHLMMITSYAFLRMDLNTLSISYRFK